MIHVFQLSLLVVGAVAMVTGHLARSDRWRIMLFGAGICIYGGIEMFAPQWRMAAALLAGAGCALFFPVLAKGRFAADRDLAREYGLAGFATVLLMLPALLSVAPGQFWPDLLPLPAALWTLAVVPRWMRRLYRRGLHSELVSAGGIWALTCLLGTSSGLWHVNDYPAAVAAVLAALAFASIAYVTHGRVWARERSGAAPA